MFKSVPEVLDYIVKNIKPYGYMRYQCFYDGIQLNKYDPIRELNELEEKCKGLRHYIFCLDIIKASINDCTKLCLGPMEYIRNYIDHPDTNFNSGFNLSLIRGTTNPYSTSSQILLEANQRATQIMEYEYVVDAINNIIANLKKNPKFYKY